MSSLDQLWTQEDLLETASLSSLGSHHREVMEHHGCFQKKLSCTRCLRMACTALHQLMGKGTWDCTTVTQNTTAERSVLWILDPLGKLFCSPAPLLHAPDLSKAAMAFNSPGELQEQDNGGMAQVLRNRHGQESSTAPGTTRRMQESILKGTRELLQLIISEIQP